MQICQCVGWTEGLQLSMTALQLRKVLHFPTGFWTSPSLLAKINLCEASPLVPDISTLLGG